MADLEISQYVVAAICGCWRRESGVNPAIWESLIPCAWDYEYEYTNRGGYGLGQWTNVGTQHGRLWDLHTYVTSQGYSDGDGDGQLEFLLEEDYWAVANYGGRSPRLGCRTLEEFLTSPSQSLEDLVWDFLACWEGVEGDNYSLRLGYARDALRYILLHKDDDVQWDWISGNRYLSLNETHNNIMVVFERIGKWKQPKKKGMPLWMMCRRSGFKIVPY